MRNKYKISFPHDRLADRRRSGEGCTRILDDLYFDCSDHVRRAFSRALQASGLSLGQVAEKVNRMCSAAVSPEQIREWADCGAYPDAIPLTMAGALAAVLEDNTFVYAAFEGAPALHASERSSVLHERLADYGQSSNCSNPRGHLVRAWMAANRHTTASVAQSLGVSPVAIRRWILGTMRSARIRKWFAENGCPEEVLGRE
jgi:hypothetical protein